MKRIGLLLLSLAVAACAVAAPALARKSKLPVEVVRIETAKGVRSFTVEVAADEKSRNYGLMNRKTMPADHGMIFDFNPPRQGVTFWMHNTLLPLDIIFVGPDARIISIARDAQPMSDALIPAGGVVRSVIEINGGLSEKLGIEPGDRVRDSLVYGPTAPAPR